MKSIMRQAALFQLLIFMAAGTIQADSKDGLVAYWPFSGDATDASGYGHNRTIHGAILTRDMSGEAYNANYFDGVNDYFFASATILPTAERTVSLWFNS